MRLELELGVALTDVERHCAFAPDAYVFLRLSCHISVYMRYELVVSLHNVFSSTQIP